MFKEAKEEGFYEVSNKGYLFMAFYDALKDKLPKEELSMDLWHKFFERFKELGGKI